MTTGYRDLFSALLPEAALVAGALLILGIDLLGLSRSRPAVRLHAALAVAALTTLVALLVVLAQGARGEVFGGALVVDRLAVAGRAGVLALTLLTLAIVPGGRALRHPPEYVAIILLAATGFTLMAAAQQLLVIFLAIELASLALYVLAGFEPEAGRRAESAEAALKYFLFGGVSAAFLLFGFSLVYGLTGSLELRAISGSLAGSPLSPLMGVALVMILVAFGFKAAAAPFHLWAPDAYQGAPVSSAALVASASKLAGVVVFTRLLVAGLGPAAFQQSWSGATNGWVYVVAAMSAASLVVGNLAALAQTNTRRLLAYSAISHAGALLLGVMCVNTAGVTPLLYYAITYGVATIGAFGVLAAVEGSGGQEKISGLAGLRRRSPFLTGCLLVFILSLAGIPPLAGFFGKFAVFAAAFRATPESGPASWLAALAVLFSAVALYYYLILLKQALVVDAPAGSGPVTVPRAAACGLLVAVAAIVVTGIWPSLLLGAF